MDVAWGPIFFFFHLGLQLGYRPSYARLPLGYTLSSHCALASTQRRDDKDSVSLAATHPLIEIEFLTSILAILTTDLDPTGAPIEHPTLR